NLAGSPYFVDGNIYVAPQTTLNIEAGVRLEFQNGITLKVDGLIRCLGSATQPVVLTARVDDWGGIHIDGGTGPSVFEYTVIEKANVNNFAGFPYGVLAVTNGEISLKNCILRDNSAPYGGGMVLERSDFTIQNCIFWNNSAFYYGGAALIDSSRGTFVNNTVFQNQCNNVGGGVVMAFGTLDFQNNIFYQNSATTGDPRLAFLTTDSSEVVTNAYNFLVLGGTNPMLDVTDNLRLLTGSPCKDAGNPDGIYQDADGSRNDQGAYGGPRSDW
ncbi:MAG TPA: right-handed parallel beta-helix repeat-containing protein, partial [Calditrichia bacterium]|nr:right-handed parallel beta-helix repeat-containing protein [Calditrichia bacterium]